MRALWDCRDRQQGLLVAHRDILRHSQDFGRFRREADLPKFTSTRPSQLSYFIDAPKYRFLDRGPVLHAMQLNPRPFREHE